MKFKIHYEVDIYRRVAGRVREPILDALKGLVGWTIHITTTANEEFFLDLTEVGYTHIVGEEYVQDEWRERAFLLEDIKKVVVK